jgi:putative ABC transport system permease protein
MSLWSRLANVVRGDRLSRDIDEELQSHLEEAIENGRDPDETRRAFGSPLKQREESRDIRLIGWLDSLRADAVFGWRQIMKKKVTSAAAILSLALAIGACTSAFRLIDALLLRPLPVTHPEQLYSLGLQGQVDGIVRTGDSWAYPGFRLMRAAVKDQAELIAASNTEQADLTYRSDQEMEKAYLQYVSGWMFGSFGLRPALGRLLTENDDVKPGGHPYAVLSHDYWVRRFGSDPNAVGRTFRMGDTLYEIVGVVDGPFSGTVPGMATDVFVPTMMHGCAVRDDCTWHRILVQLKPGVDPEPVRAKLHASWRAFESERAKGFSGKISSQFLDLKVVMAPAAAGASGLQQAYRPALLALAVLVGLVLLIACANVANLMAAQTAARAREMALRVSIGAGRWRLVQLVLVESAWLAFLAAAMGAWFAWWSAPFVVARISLPDNPVRLDLPADWRVLGFGLLLTVSVMFLFGLAPALRASAVRPASALKGGEDPHARRRLMHVLVAAQTAFCFLVLFLAGLFVTTFERLSKQPIGFSADRVLALETVAASAQPTAYWDQVAEHLRTVPGVETVGIAESVLLAGWSWNNLISVNGAPPNGILAYLLQVSPGWTDALRIRLIDGRDFRPGDVYPGGVSTGSAIVNETFAKTYFNGVNPVGKPFAVALPGGVRKDFVVVGLVGDVTYRDIHESILPQAYFPFHTLDSNGTPVPRRRGTFMVRTSGSNPLALASILRQEVPRARPEFRVSNVRTQADLVLAQTVRERLLAMLALFFAGVALALAGIGLYGVLDYSVFQRRREIGIRLAVGARAGDIARRVTAEVFSMVVLGAAVGLALGLASARYIGALLYQVKATDLSVLVAPGVAMMAAAVIAAVPPVIRAVRIDPVTMLRAD